MGQIQHAQNPWQERTANGVRRGDGASRALAIKLPHRHGSLEQPILFDNIAGWLLLFFQHTFVDQTLQPCLGLRV